MVEGEVLIDIPMTNLIAGWLGILGGILSGAVVGAFFHRDNWLGGYSALPRRLVRLGHISFFGLGFINVLFAHSFQMAEIAAPYASVSSVGLVVGLISMPTCCFLAAWRKPLRHLFGIPLASTLIGVVGFLLGMIGP